MGPQSVGIIGGGPSGLVAAKTLLQWPAAQYEVTVFERSSVPGGLWPTSSDGDDSARNKWTCDPQMSLNTSRFSATFSDLAWENVDLPDPSCGERTSETAERKSVPIFPKAWQAGRYLEQYADKFVPDGVLRFGCEVKSAELIEESLVKKWRLRVERTEAPDRKILSSPPRDVFVFGRLIIASGFLSQPQASPDTDRVLTKERSKKLMSRIVHSSNLKRLLKLLEEGRTSVSGDKILVTGGANSGGDTAATLAFHISSAIHCPREGTADLEAVKTTRNWLRKLKIFHIIPRPIYAVPDLSAVPDSSEGQMAPFVPSDVCFWDLSSRPPGSITCFGGRQSEDAMKMLHGLAQAAVGGDQSDLRAPSLVADMTLDGAMHATLTDTYSEYVRSGNIVPIKGRLAGLCGREPYGNTFVANLVDSTKIDYVAAAVDATGFSASKTLSIFAQDVLDALEYDQSSQRLPVMLSDFQTSNPSVPSLAFMGFYEGTYWGMLEMQARLIAHRWSDSKTADFSHDSKPLNKADDFESLANMRALRAAIKARALDVPQYWLGDFAGYMEGIAQELALPRADEAMRTAEGKPIGNATPARYLSPSRTGLGAAKREAQITLRALRETTSDPRTYQTYTAQAVFRALQGDWDLHRAVSFTPGSEPIMTLTGSAFFHPRVPTSGAFDREYLLHEQIPRATTSDNIDPIGTSWHRQVWRYCEDAKGTTQGSRDEDKGLTIWQIKTDEEALAAEQRSHRLDFGPGVHDEGPENNRSKDGEQPSGRCQRAHAQYRQDEEQITARYEFWFRTVAIDKWRVCQTFEGPTETCTIQSLYTRPRTKIEDR